MTAEEKVLFERLVAVGKRLLEWNTQVGTFVAPPWTELREVIDIVRDKEETFSDLEG